MEDEGFEWYSFLLSNTDNTLENHLQVGNILVKNGYEEIFIHFKDNGIGHSCTWGRIHNKEPVSKAAEEVLKKLEELPLTENFFNQCVEDFPYIENVEEYKEISIEFWSVDEEGKCVSLVSFCKEKNPMDNPILAKPDHVYCIEMDIVGDQINALRMEFMQ